MEIGGVEHPPIPEKEQIGLDQVTLIDQVLKSASPDFIYSGTSLSWHEKSSTISQTFIIELPKVIVTIIERLAQENNQQEMIHALVLSHIRQQILSSQPSLMNSAGYKITKGYKRISPEQRNQASNLLQKELARISHEKQKAENLQIHLQNIRDRQAHAEQKRFDFHRLSEEENKMRQFYDGLHASSANELTPRSFRFVGTEETRTAHQRIQDHKAQNFKQQEEQHPQLGFGALLETFMRVELSRQDWFGANYIQTSRHDDYENGVDGMLEWSEGEEGSSIRLAIDFTTAESNIVLKKKLEKMERGVSVKYFRSSLRDRKGHFQEESLSGVPMVILGMDRALLRKILQETGGIKEQLSEHQIRALVIEQAAVQIGYQVREMIARLVGNIFGREGNVSKTLVQAVDQFIKEKLHDLSVQKNIAAITELFSGITRDEFAKGFQDKTQGERLWQIIRIYRQLNKRRTKIGDTYLDAKQWAGDSITHKRLTRDSVRQASPGLLSFVSLPAALFAKISSSTRSASRALFSKKSTVSSTSSLDPSRSPGGSSTWCFGSGILFLSSKNLP